uniref:NB-ARC domain-containing protein n=1 Tax=Oryza meridionalis TaxID=40149 RepID=A0A0E0C7A3_9ORYZ
MNMLVPAAVSDIAYRLTTFAIKKYQQLPDAEAALETLNRLLLRAQTIIEEAEGKCIANEGMLHQLQMLIEGMYRGHYLLDRYKYPALQEDRKDEEVSHVSSFSKFNPAKRLRFSSHRRTLFFGSNSIKELQGMIATIEEGISDMMNLVVFLRNYRVVHHQPRDTYSVLENCMFGRQMEHEQVLSFLLQTDGLGDEDFPVLPIIGPRKCGKSTLVEHACRDYKVRNHYSSILFLRGNNLKDARVANLRENGVVKHQNYSSCKRLLIIIELACDISEQTWQSLKSSVNCWARGSKIIITSRSDKIENLGTTAAIRLDLLHPEAYWYFFKMLAFGSRNPDEHPKLASVAMEIATEYSGSFLAAYTIGGLLRDNFNAQFWCSTLKYLRAYIRNQLLVLGDHPNNLLRKGQWVHCLRFAEASDPLWMSDYYETDSCPDQAPNISDIMLGNSTPRGRFEALGWKSRMAPYYSYMICCSTEAPGHAVGRKKRSYDRFLVFLFPVSPLRDQRLPRGADAAAMRSAAWRSRMLPRAGGRADADLSRGLLVRRPGHHTPPYGRRSHRGGVRAGLGCGTLLRGAARPRQYSLACGCGNDDPKVMLHEVHTGTSKAHGKFEVLVWRSRIPPYHEFVMSCEAQAQQHTIFKRKRAR